MKIEYIFGFIIEFLIGVIFVSINLITTDSLYVDGVSDAIKHPERFRTEYNITTSATGDTIRVDTIVSKIR